MCLCFDAFADKVSERLLLELRSEGLWESLLCPMKIINKICFSAHPSSYWKCKNNYLFFPAENILPSLQNLRCDAEQVRNKTILPSNLRTVAAKKGFLVSDNQASGNCLFYALSEQLQSVKGIQISHKELRNTLVQFLRENANQVRWLNFIMLGKNGRGLYCVSYKIQDYKANLIISWAIPCYDLGTLLICTCKGEGVYCKKETMSRY